MSAAAPGDGTGLVPSAYADAFVRGPPREGVQRVQTRLHKARILTDELADYFAARRELEASYLKSLQKIARRSFLSDPAALGPNFLPVYERLVAEIGEIARIHGDLEKRLEVECEAPMRTASAKGDWSRIKEHDDNLSSTLKEINSLESQLVKDQKKLEASSAKKASQASQKASETERALRQTMELWEAEAPFAFEGYQRIDAQRLELMKEVVAKFETVQSDAAQRIMQMTEQSMQVALNFDPQEDMQEFVLKSGTASGALGRSRTPATTTPTQTRTNRAPSLTVTGAPSGGGATASTIAASTLTAGGGQSSNGVNEFGRAVRQSSASIHSTDRSGGQVQEQSSTVSSKLGGSTLKSALTRFGRGRSNRDKNEATSYGALSEDPGRITSTSDSRPREALQRRSTESRRSDLDSSGALPSSLMAPMAPTTLQTPSKSRQQQSSSSPAPPAREVDEEGFTIPPANRDRKPWELDPVDTGAPSSSLLDENDEATESLDTSSPAAGGRVTGMSIAKQSIREDDASEQAALERMRSTLLTARSPAMAPPHRRNTTRRDRRDVRNTTYNPGAAADDAGARPVSSFGLPMVGSSPTQTAASPSNAFNAAPGFGPDRSQSMVSSGSASNIGNATLDSIATASAPIAHGLNAQISERINVVLQGRTVAKIMVVGEISVTARDVSVDAPLHMRIDSFEQLEKAAPNPQYMKELSGKPGEYSLDVAAIARQGGPTGAGRATVLKYQLHVAPHKANDYVPLHVTPQWRCEDTQTSILINYVANAESRIITGAAPEMPNAAVQDIVISTDITSSSVSNVMSKPAAIYSAEQKKLYWRLNEPLPLADGSAMAAHKALARFAVDAKSEPRPVEVRWKLPGLTASSLGVSLVDASEVQFGTIARQLVSGKYVAHP